MVPLHAEGSLQTILQMLARPTPTAEDPTKRISIGTQTVPSILMIYIQRKRPDGWTCRRSIEYGQRLTYCGAKYGLRGALHFHSDSDHYTAVVGRGNKYYNCDDSVVREITRSEAFDANAYGNVGSVQMLMYSRIMQ